MKTKVLVMSKKFVDYYTLLDVKRESTKEQIKEAFMTQALKWHPEKAENDEDKKLHTKIYADLQQAYKVLSNDETRKMYKDSQQNTIDDFRTQKRDVGYQKSDKYSSKTGTGIKFDSSVFSDAFNNTRNKEDLQALNQFHNSINNDVVTEALENVKKGVFSGDTLTKLFLKEPLFPPTFSQLISVGEQTGQLDEMFNSVSAYYEEEFDTTVDNMSALIEPIMIVFMGIMIGGLMIAMYSPIFNVGALIG